MLLAGSKTDGRLFFVHTKSMQFNKFELLGFTDMLNPIIALAWETKTSTGYSSIYRIYNINFFIKLNICC